MTENYYRLVTILVNICPRPLRELFLKHAAADTSLQAPYTTLDAYLAFRKKDITKLTQKPKCVLRKDQYNLLFPCQGGQADINGWDVTLLSVLLQNLFQIAPKDLTSIENIRKTRNDLQHIAGTCNISEQEFKNNFKQLSADSIGIALSVNGQGYADQIKNDISDVETSILTNLGDVLRDWYMTKILTMQMKIDNLEEQIAKIDSKTGKIKKIMKGATEKRTRTGGKFTKYFKTVSGKLTNMRGTFVSLLKNKLDVDFKPPPETASIIRELEENHLVVVSGYGKGLYLQAALSAIASKKYGDGECVLVSHPSDWRHIGNEDAKLVVFLHPFGEKTFDLEKAKSMNSTMDTIMTVQDNDDVVDVVIITDQSLLEECKQHFSHDMIENPIIVYKPTTIDSPVDLSEGDNQLPLFEADPHYKNLLVQSIAYYKHHKAQMVDDSLKEDALELFRSKKVIVISGSRGHGKTTLALSLLSSYQDGHYLILTEPGDLRYVRFGVTCVVVIEDLGGKYKLDMSVLQKWMRKFDMLYSAVKEGKLNVIITCLSERLSLCVEDSKHPMLETVIELPKCCQVKIKKESSMEFNIVNIPSRMNNQSTPLFTRVKEIQAYKIDLPEITHIINRSSQICQYPDGSYLLVFIEIEDTPNVSVSGSIKLKIVLQHISSDFVHKCYYDTDIDYWYKQCNICCSDTGDVVISYGYDIRMYRISNGTLQLILSKQLIHYTGIIHFHRSRFILVDKYGHCLILDKNQNVKRKVLLVQHVMNSKESFVFQPCSQHLYFSFISDENLKMFCEDTRLQQIKYLRKENFYPRYMCAATDDSVFVYGEQDDHGRILQVNSDMTVLLDLCTEMRIGRYQEYAKMLYEKQNGRLVIVVINDYDEQNSIIAIDLE